MEQMVAAYVQDYQAPIEKKEMGIALMLCDRIATPEKIVLTAQIYANARSDLKQAMGKAVAVKRMAFRRLKNAILKHGKTYVKS